MVGSEHLVGEVGVAVHDAHAAGREIGVFEAGIMQKHRFCSPARRVWKPTMLKASLGVVLAGWTTA